MKRVTASEARRNWFRLLDEVIAGEVVVIERNGARVFLRREAHRVGEATERVPDYRGLVAGRDADRADEWDWEWHWESGVTTRDRDS
jgi:hypothetical protein